MASAAPDLRRSWAKPRCLPDPVQHLGPHKLPMSIRLFTNLLLTGFVAVLAGCASPGGQLHVTRTGTNQTFSQSFDQAWIARDADGDYDIIFVHRSTSGRKAPRAGQALQPVDHLPVRHIVHAHVFWRPRGAARSDDPATSNAAVNWYVLTLGASSGDDVVVYRGAGYVGVHPGDDAAAVTLRNVRLEPQLVRGAMTDPIGAARIEGNAHALADPEQVRAILDELQSLGIRNDR